MVKMEARPHTRHTPVNESQISVYLLTLMENNRLMSKVTDALAKVKERMKKISLASTPWNECQFR